MGPKAAKTESTIVGVSPMGLARAIAIQISHEKPKVIAKNRPRAGTFLVPVSDISSPKLLSKVSRTIGQNYNHSDCYGAVEKTRTSTGVTPQRPQRCASTNSATAAH